MERQQPLDFPHHPYDIPASHLNAEFFDMLEEIGRTSYIDSLETLNSNLLKERPPIDRRRFQRVFQAISEKNYSSVSQHDFAYIRSVFDDTYITTFKQVCQAYDPKQKEILPLAYLANKYQKTLITLVDHLSFLGQLDVIHLTFSTQTKLHTILDDKVMYDALQRLIRDLPEIWFGNHFTYQWTQYMFVIKYGRWWLYDVTHQSLLSTREQHIVSRFTPPHKQLFLIDCPRYYTPEVIHDRILSFTTSGSDTGDLDLFLTHLLFNPKDIVQTIHFISEFRRLRTQLNSEGAFIKNVCSEQYRWAFAYKLADMFREQKIYQAQQTLLQLSKGVLKPLVSQSYDQILTEPRYIKLDNEDLIVFIAQKNDKNYLISTSNTQTRTKELSDEELCTIYQDTNSGREFC